MSEKRKPPAEEQETVAESDLAKGLVRLEQMAKGQIIGKLPGNSGPKGRFAYGQQPDKVGDDESDVSSDSGEDELEGDKSDTDYKAKSAPVQKGMGDDDGDSDEDDDPQDSEDDDDKEDPFEGEEDADDDDKDGEKKPPPPPSDTDKSFAARARSSKHIRSGVEVSPFLRDTVRSINKSFRDHERRIVRALGHELSKSARLQRQLFKSMAKVLSGLGAVTLEHGDLLKALAAQPARGPKSQTHAVRPVQKSFDGGDDSVTLPDGTSLPQLGKAELMQRLLNGVAKGLIGSGEVIKFETTGIVHPALYKSLATDERFWK